jgi:hypothetical protein
MAKEQAKMLIEQIQEVGSESEDEDKNAFVKAADRFGGKAMQVPKIEVKKHDDEEIKKAA